MLKMRKRYAQNTETFKMRKRYAQNAETLCSKCGNAMLKMRKRYAQNAETLCSKTVLRNWIYGQRAGTN